MSSTESETRIKILAATWRLMIEQRGQGVRMSDIAAEAGVSRQALYLHFSSRADLLVATTHYGDELRGLDERLTRWRAATTGIERLVEFVDFWGNYLPEIYGIAKALLLNRENDEAAATAWNERMEVVRGGCRYSIETLERDGRLAEGWTIEEATDLFWTTLSISNWEQYTNECGWSTEQYVSRMQAVLKRTLVKKLPKKKRKKPSQAVTA